MFDNSLLRAIIVKKKKKNLNLTVLKVLSYANQHVFFVFKPAKISYLLSQTQAFKDWGKKKGL